MIREADIDGDNKVSFTGTLQLYYFEFFFLFVLKLKFKNLDQYCMIIKLDNIVKLTIVYNKKKKE